MTRSICLVVALLTMWFVPHAATAAPLTPAPQGILAQDLVVQVHGCNRSCSKGYVPRWGVTARHRHVGPGCYPRACGKPYNSLPPGWGNRGCFKIGALWYCP